MNTAVVKMVVVNDVDEVTELLGYNPTDDNGAPCAGNAYIFPASDLTDEEIATIVAAGVATIVTGYLSEGVEAPFERTLGIWSHYSSRDELYTIDWSTMTYEEAKSVVLSNKHQLLGILADKIILEAYDYPHSEHRLMYKLMFDAYAVAVEAAKDVGRYDVANEMFTGALNACWAADDAEVARIYIESYCDPYEEESCDIKESYYDLVHLHNDRFDICIPAPLLDQLVAMSCYRGAEVKPRVEHQRDIKDDYDALNRLTKKVEGLEEIFGSFRMPVWLNDEAIGT